MKQAMLPFKTPENQDECNETSCGECSILYDTINAAKLPQCHYLEKSRMFLEMISA